MYLKKGWLCYVRWGIDLKMTTIEGANSAPRRQLSSDCNTLELTNGKATSLMDLSDNQISTNSNLSNQLVLRLLFRLLNPCPLSLLLTIITAIVLPDSLPYPLVLYAAEFCLVLVLILVKESYFDHMRRKADQKVNQSQFIMKESKLYRDGEEMPSLSWGDIKEGDIIYLEKGQKAPADMLVLDTQHIEDREAVVYVDAKSITGRVTVERKKACYLTQVTSRSAVKRNWDKYKKQYLNGKLKYQLPNPNMEEFLGYLKLVKDPKTSLITFQNFISRESIVKTCWVYGLVLNAGMNCKIMRHIGERNRNHKFFENHIDRIFVSGLVLNVMLGLPYTLLAVTQEYHELASTVAYHFMLFSVGLPVFLYLGNGLLLLYFSFKHTIEADIINYSSIINLGNIDYAVMAYTGVLNSGKLAADQIITTSSFYDFREEAQATLQRGSRRTGSMNEKNPVNTNSRGSRNKYFMSICNSLANSRPSGLATPNAFQSQKQQEGEFDAYFLDDDYRQDSNIRLQTTSKIGGGGNAGKYRVQLEPLRISKQKLSNNVLSQEEESLQLVKAFSICHQAILKSVDSQDIKFEANSRNHSEEVLLRLVNTIGVHVSTQIDARTKKEVAIRLKLQDIDKEWFFNRRLNTFAVQKKVFSAVVREERSDQRVLYCKGSPVDMLDKLRDRQIRKNLIDNKLAQFKQTKAEVLIYGKRTLSSQEYELYDAEFTKLKMSTSLQLKDLQQFSATFERELQFVCVVGLSSERSEAANQMSEYLVSKGVKMGVFANSLSQIQSLKQLIGQGKRGRQTEYVQFEGNTMEEITYNLNAITRKLNSQQEYVFSMVIGRQCWKLLTLHHSLMQHFLLAAYYAFNVLTHGLTPKQKAEFTQRLKNSYNRPHTILSIGSSYSDLLFENHSDVSLIISSCEGERVHSDIPSDIRAPTIASLRNIIELGSWVSTAYSHLIDTSVYRAIALITIVTVLQTRIFAIHGTSYALNGPLVTLYLIVYGGIETIFTIIVEQRKSKAQSHQKVAEQQARVRFILNIVEAITHGLVISLVVLLVLPNARMSRGRIFPIETMHFSMYFLLLTVSVWRHAVSGECSKAATAVLALISYPTMLGLLWVGVGIDENFYKIAIQIVMVWYSYDSSIMLINVIIFSLACSMFLAEARRKGMIGILADHYLQLKEGSSQLKSKQLLDKDINCTELVKHLFKNVDNIEESVQELVGSQFDTNELSISTLLEIKKTQHRIKNQFSSVSANLSRLQITLVVLALIVITDIIYFSVKTPQDMTNLIPLFLGVVLLAVALGCFLRYGQDLGRKYYTGVEHCLACFFILLAIYLAVGGNQQSFLVVCISFIVLTQLVGIRLIVVLVISGGCLLVGVVIQAITQDTRTYILLKILFMVACGVINIAVLYASTLQSKKNFILREQIQMQTNQTNDIWTILVPQFVRTFFAENGQEGGQYRQGNVAILFCYICGFDSIIEEQGRNVVRILDDLFRQFDRLCSSFAIQKIETVGYTYMAASGIRKIENQMQNDMVRKNKVERLLSMAQQMLEKAKLFKWGTKKNKNLQIKIGIHVGEVVVGVIGKHKKQFSLIGTNVNVTSRHGSVGAKNSITLSRDAKSELHHIPEDAFIRKDVYLKGLCKLETDTIDVYQLKVEEVQRRSARPSALKIKFKELVMKIIRANRISNEDSSDDSEQMAPLFPIEKERQLGLPQMRDVRRRTTCRGLENNFNKIEEMKNRQDETKCYSSLLEFDPQLARQHFREAFPRKTEESLDFLVEKEKDTQDAYFLHLENNRGLRDKIFVSVLLSMNCIFLAANLTLFDSPTHQVALRIVGIVVTLLLYWLTGHFHAHWAVNWVVVVIFAYLIIVEETDIMDGQTVGREFGSFYIIMTLTLLSGLSGIRLLHVVVIGIGTVGMGIVSVLVLNSLQLQNFHQWFYIVLVLIRKYDFQKQSIINFRQGAKTVQLSNQLSKIVSQLLPKHAYQKLKTQNFENRLQLTDLFQQCTILFADIKGFTEFSDRPQNRKQPQNVVRMLRLFYEEFDALCTQYNVYKMYTIGDCYVVMGFTNCYDRNPVRQAKNVVNYSFEMLKTIEKVKKQRPHLSCLNMRIGIHTGTIIGGIVGTEIVRYDIYGSDVVVANKFEQAGKIGQIHISEETKKLLDQLQKKPYSENNIYPSQKVEVTKLNVSYNGYFIKRGNLS